MIRLNSGERFGQRRFPRPVDVIARPALGDAREALGNGAHALYAATPDARNLPD
jgi:hypothetical protein